MSNTYTTNLENYGYNFRQIAIDVRAVNSASIETVDQYVAWVREWKRVYKALSQTIRDGRTARQNAKTGFEKMGIQIGKLSLRPFAREMCEIRVTNKARLHAGEFVKQTEEA